MNAAYRDGDPTPTPVILNGILELFPKPTAPGWVRCDHPVPLVRKDLRIPPGAPGVCPRPLRAAVDVEQQRIRVVLAEVSGVDDPGVNLSSGSEGVQLRIYIYIYIYGATYIGPVPFVVKLVDIGRAQATRFGVNIVGRE